MKVSIDVKEDSEKDSKDKGEWLFEEKRPEGQKEIVEIRIEEE